MTVSDSTSVSAARALGAELRQLRTADLPGCPPMTQQQMANVLFVGGKGVISMFESGKRLPDVAVIAAYAEQSGADVQLLLQLHQNAVDERARFMASDRIDSPASTHDETSRVAPAEPDTRDRPASRTHGRRLPSEWRARHRVAAVAAAAAVGGAVLIGLVVARSTSDQPVAAVHISVPVGSTGPTTPVDGTTRGLEGDDLWLDVQSIGEQRHHPTDVPCTRSGPTFGFSTLYVGRAEDAGVMFRVSVVATPRGGAADAALVGYGKRSKTAPGAYDGLTALPSGSTVVGTIYLRRT